MKTKKQPLQKVRIEDLGLFLKTIHLDYKPKDNQERADLISEHFNVICTLEDIEEYEMMYEYHQEQIEDFETEDRRHSYFQKLNMSNPFY
jgi:hypothetical protein